MSQPLARPYVCTLIFTALQSKYCFFWNSDEESEFQKDQGLYPVLHNQEKLSTKPGFKIRALTQAVRPPSPSQSDACLHLAFQQGWESSGNFRQGAELPSWFPLVWRREVQCIWREKTSECQQVCSDQTPLSIHREGASAETTAGRTREIHAHPHTCTHVHTYTHVHRHKHTHTHIHI